MGTKFTYEGGPRDKESSEAEESDFPEIHEGGEYRAAGFPHSQSRSGSPDEPLPEADQATAVWHPKEK